MKIKYLLAVSVLSLIFCQAPQVFGIVALRKTCPKSFAGKVKQISSLGTPSSSLPKISVVFDVIEIKSGEVQEQEVFETLKNGPHGFKEGEIYWISARKNYLCSVKHEERFLIKN